MTYMYSAVISPSDRKDKFYASVPDIPGCITTGSNLSDAIDQITDALAGCLCVMEDEGDPIPVPSDQGSISRKSADFCTLIRVDTVAYRAQTDKRSVRKNVSLPAWMANLAEKRGINCSKVLQDALRAKLS